MSDNVEVLPDVITQAEELLASSRQETDRSADQMTTLSGRQDDSKWTDLMQTRTARTRTTRVSEVLARQMRRASELADRYVAMLQQTNAEFQSLDEAGQDAMAARFEALRDETTLGNYNVSVRPSLNEYRTTEVRQTLQQLANMMGGVLPIEAILPGHVPGPSTPIPNYDPYQGHVNRRNGVENN